MVMGHRVVHHLVTPWMVVLTKLGLHARAADGAQHGRRHGAPNGEQDSQQQQEADTDSFHVRQTSMRVDASFGLAETS